MAEDTSKQPIRRKGTKREPLSSGTTQTTGATKPSFMSKAFKPKPKVEAVGSDAKPSTKKISSKKPNNATKTAAQARAERIKHSRKVSFKTVRTAFIVLLSLALLAGIAFLVLRSSSVFAITNIQVEPTEHVTNEQIQKLIAVEEGTTLLNMDESLITEELQKDPWVASATYERQFPNTLRITITERKVTAIVALSSGPVAWYLGENNVWLEADQLNVPEGKTTATVALEKATSEGELLITDVPATVSPVAGTTATDAEIQAVMQYQSTFSSELTSQIVSYSASSVDAISVTLTNGVQVALGSPTQIADKEKVILAMLKQFPGELTYLNVRTPTSPTYRRVSTGNVQSGSGVS